jgi:hypothetical protein
MSRFISAMTIVSEICILLHLKRLFLKVKLIKNKLFNQNYLFLFSQTNSIKNYFYNKQNYNRLKLEFLSILDFE